MEGKIMKKLKEYYVFTCEHRRYKVKATSKLEAEEYLAEQADLSLKDNRVKLDEFGHFEIVS
jgi:hypothetical protein